MGSLSYSSVKVSGSGDKGPPIIANIISTTYVPWSLLLPKLFAGGAESAKSWSDVVETTPTILSWLVSSPKSV